MHGSTPAAWSAVIICLVGFAVGAIGVVLSVNWVLFVVGVVLVALSPIVGKVMSVAGFGEKASH